MKDIMTLAKEYLKDCSGSHDFDHTMRVYNLCMHIGEMESADMEVLKIAALLHDIGRRHEDESKSKVCHAQKSAELAREILKSYENEKIDRICHCIGTHRYNGNRKPESKEAKILFDADKLDAIGAVGVGRAFLFAGEVGARLHDKDVNTSKDAAYTKDDTAYREYSMKLKHIKDRMLTKEGRRLAQERHDFMERFFERLNHETEGLI